MGKVAEASSVRRNLRSLITPSPDRLGPLVGVRALSVVWVALFHAGWYSLGQIRQKHYLYLLNAGWMLPFWRGDFGVDVFFVLSGFLIGGMLIDERARTGRARVGLFYVRRLMRLWPALAAATALDVIVFDDRPKMAWASLVYLSNFVPVGVVCIGWSWSLALEEQFYLVSPWLVRATARLGPYARGLAFTAIALALAAVGAWVIVRGGFTAHDTEVVINRDPLQWAKAFDALYTKPWMRAGPLLMGVVAAIAHRSERARALVDNKPLRAAVLFATAVAVAAACTHWQLVAKAPRAVEVAFMALYRTLFGACVGYGIVFSLAPNGPGKALGEALSWRGFLPFAELAYSAYLLNPMVATLVHRAVAPRIPRWIEPMSVLMPLDLAATFLAALALHLLIERPFMELRPKG